MHDKPLFSHFFFFWFISQNRKLGPKRCICRRQHAKKLDADTKNASRGWEARRGALPLWVTPRHKLAEGFLIAGPWVLVLVGE